MHQIDISALVFNVAAFCEAWNIEDEWADAHLIHVIYRKVYLETLDAEEHHAGTEAFQS